MGYSGGRLARCHRPPDGAYTITGETTIDYQQWNLKVIRKALLFTVSPEVKIRFKFTGVPVEEPKS